MASIFADCNSLASFTIGNSVSDIGDWVFYGCISLTSVTIPNSVINIGKYAFSACRKLTSIAIPNSVTNIGGFAFSDCTHLGSVTVGSSVDTIGGYAFSWCLRVTGVYFTGNAPSLFPLGSDVFDIESHTTVYYLPNTKGWELTLSGRPTALWNQQAQLIIGRPGILSNQFGFAISNQVVVVEACTNLNNPAWSPLLTNTLIDGSSYFSDPQWTNYPSRFYRLRSP